MQDIGFFLFHLLIFGILFLLIVRAQKVSAFFKVFIVSLLAVLFISPLYLRVHDLTTSIGDAKTVEVTDTVTGPTPLPLALPELQALFVDGIWKETRNDAGDKVEYMFQSNHDLRGIALMEEGTLTKIDFGIVTTDENFALALLDLQLVMTKVDVEFVRTGWLSAVSGRIRSVPGESFEESMGVNGLTYTVKYDAEKGRLIVGVEGK